MALDHLLWAAPDLDEGAARFAALTGVEPAPGGSHPGFGTRNGLVSLGDDAYLEIIAPDPEQALVQGTRGARLAALARPGLLTFAVRTRDLGALAATAAAAGLGPAGPIRMGRRRPDGLALEWAILDLHREAFGDAIPFAIDWEDCPHPSRSTPTGCELKRFAVLHPEADALRTLYGRLGLEVDVIRALRPGFLALLATPRGEVALQSP